MLRWIASWAALVGGAATSPADDVTTRYFDQLRQRQFFHLAEGYCLERLAVAGLSDADRTTFTLELARTFAEHAQFTAGEESTDLWRRAADALANELAAHPENPERTLIEVQEALTIATQGEALRWQAEVVPYDDEAAATARTVLDAALERLAAIDTRLTERVRTATAPEARNAAIGPAKLRDLLATVRWRRAQASLDRGRLTPRGSPDRAGFLQEAEARFRRLASELDDASRNQSLQIQVAECQRLLGNLTAATAILDRLSHEDQASDVADRFVAARAELWLDSNRPDDAVREIKQRREKRPDLPGELRLLEIRGWIAAWDVARERRRTDLAESLRKQVETAVERTDREVGGYWGYRGRLLLDFANDAARHGTALAMSMRRAQALYSHGRIDDATAEYRRAYHTATSAGRADLAVDLGLTLGSVELQSGRFEEASRHFVGLAEKFAAQARAGEAHLLGAYSAGRLYDRDRTKERRLAYADLLERHRERYAGQPGAFEATWMLAQLEERRLQFTRALELYLTIPADHARGDEAHAGAARCYEFVFARLKELRRDRGEWERDALQRVGAFAAELPPPPEPLDRVQAELALRFGRILLGSAQPEYQRADDLLARIDASWQRVKAAAESVPEPVEEDWRALVKTATQLRIVALAGRGELAKAQSLVRVLAETSSAEVLRVLDGITQLGVDADERTRRGLAELQLQAAEELNRRRDGMAAADRTLVDHCLAQAYLATNQPRRALDVYESLLAAAPNDEKLLTTVAGLQSDCGTDDCLKGAQTNWRKIEAKHRQGTIEWLTARIRVAETGYRLGEFDETRKLVDVTRLLYPQLGTPELKDRYAALEKKLEQAPR